MEESINKIVSFGSIDNPHWIREETNWGPIDGLKFDERLLTRRTHLI